MTGSDWAGGTLRPRNGGGRGGGGDIRGQQYRDNTISFILADGKV